MEDLPSFVKPTEISNAAQIIANDNNFNIKSYRFVSQVSDDTKIIKLGSIQTSIVAPTTAIVDKQKEIIFRKVEKIIEAAAIENVNVLCLPELWYMPYPFYTPKQIAWREFAEDAESGASTKLMKNLAAKYKMIIISSILEKESNSFYNTTLVTSTTGNLIGKYRKIHIPPIEQPFLQPGDFNHPVFDTEFGKVGIVICYERHFPLCWMMHGLQRADIVFNPSSEDDNSMSERLWFVEGLNAAVSNAFFTVMVNRTGCETFNNEKSFHYFGSNYSSSPFGYSTPHLPRGQDGLLITEIDLNDCRKVRKELPIHDNSHLDIYLNKLNQINLDRS